ncbi:hypothetical protein [Kaistella jeonii]|uniref:DUF4412 domain-containing protein n=1 Tax=Kaistella jeonii TaxID=266749 RepID=A0A0C1CV40_9FLAO|nr:hypothetical protein [Kaistella jeonii]KIA88151.1 hypothetical protein OA86_12435 [Kaistella jeonii]SFC29428.1 hypothetical protein SAMN05421876_11254 [Kaistella jeonii]VEI96885.1 Uncharacterised protein [Kaistella jeonii]
MKKIYTLVAIVCLSLHLSAQNASKSAHIIKLMDGKEMKGTVVKVSANEVTFVYEGEKAEYTVKNSDIEKIEHSSGRVEVYNNKVVKNDNKDLSAKKYTRAERKNKIAIMPFTFFVENDLGPEQIGLKAQEDTYGLIARNTPGYTILDARTTNALLNRAGAKKENIANFTMEDLCEIVGAEYIITGTVSQTKADKIENERGRVEVKPETKGNDVLTGITGIATGSKSKQQNYNVAVTVHIYKDDNTSIYSRSHKAFFPSTDGSFADPLQYIMKRNPLYKK